MRRSHQKVRSLSYKYLALLSYFVLVFLLLLHFYHLFADFLNLFLNITEKIFFFKILIILGGPISIIFSIPISLKSKRLSGAILLLGASFLSLGIAFESEYFIFKYIKKMILFALPQIFVSIIFLLEKRFKKIIDLELKV